MKYVYPVMAAVALACGGCTVPPDYLAADRATLQAIRPVVDEHCRRHPDQAQTYQDLVATWERRIDAARR